ELERIKAQRDLKRAEKEAHVLQKWRRGLIFVSALMLIASVCLLIFIVRVKRAEARATSAQKTTQTLNQKLEQTQNTIQLLQGLTNASPEVRLQAVGAIQGKANKEGIPQALGNALVALVLTDRDPKVVQAAQDLIPEIVKSNPELAQAHASIQLESQDNQDQKARADKIKDLLIARGIVVADYDYGKLAPPKNQLRYCIPEGTSPPDQLLQLISSTDGNRWEMTAISGCEKSASALYGIWFGSDRRAALKELLAVEKRWKDARVNGNIVVLQGIFADEFTNTDEAGNTYDKAEWVGQFRGGDPSFRGWKISDPKLVSYGGNTATITFTLLYGGTVGRSKESDTFVKRDGRWRVLASRSAPSKWAIP
ncbi:MAG: hypothetical protein DMF76_26760, partial [Acidobacteria bacterium]